MAELTITIPDEYVQELKSGLEIVIAIPVNSEGIPITNFKTVMEWWIKKQIFRAYRAGKEQIAKDSAVSLTEDDIFL